MKNASILDYIDGKVSTVTDEVFNTMTAIITKLITTDYSRSDDIVVISNDADNIRFCADDIQDDGTITKATFNGSEYTNVQLTYAWMYIVIEVAGEPVIVVDSDFIRSVCPSIFHTV